MAWIEKLHATYEACKGREPPGAVPLMPISHTPQQAHIEIAIDGQGNFKSAKIIQKEETVIPATDKSASRTAGEAAHPLCDKVQYCAADYATFGGSKPPYYQSYEALLSSWCDSPFQHPKAQAVLAYVKKGKVVADLVKERLLHVGVDGKLLTEWQGEEAPEIFRVLTAKEGKRDQGDAFIRWQVWFPDSPNTTVWADSSLQDAWIGFDAASKDVRGLCMVTGECGAALALSHPKRIRHAGDGAKLVSANDDQGYTFRGRFTDKEGQQACGVGYEVTQKAHNALRWLIGRQAYRSGDQVIVSWAVAGKPVPDPFKDTLALILGNDENAQLSGGVEPGLADDAGQSFALRFKQAIRGYRANLDITDDIVVMGLDSATPGRMAITYYRELKGAEFLDRIERWHEQYAWAQDFGKKIKFVGTPAPRDIAEAAYGMRLDEKLRKATVERLLPCIIDGQVVPIDLVRSTARRAANRVGLDHWEWEKCLGIACALFRGYSESQGKEYQMALEEDRTTRDYLYGRLLAIADSVEGYSLKKAGETRETTAARLMQRFADRPYSTWRNIELALRPYQARLRTSEKGAGFLWKREKLLDEILSLFQSDDFTSDHALSAEFLLGYHCQRAIFLRGTEPVAADDQSTTE
jgi:CRISPR-associated protein Csd1